MTRRTIFVPPIPVDGSRVFGFWPDLTALEIYNRLLGGVSEGYNRSTTDRRLWALQIFRRQFSLRLHELLVELCQMWPHWEQPKAGPLDINKCCDELCRLFVHLESAGKPAALDAWRPTTRRSRNVSADQQRIIRRFLDTSYAKPERKRRPERPVAVKISRGRHCRIHPEKETVAYDFCGQCHQRYLKFLAADIVKADTPADLLNKLLRMPVVKGPGSTMMNDARRLVREHHENG